MPAKKKTARKKRATRVETIFFAKVDRYHVTQGKNLNTDILRRQTRYDIPTDVGYIKKNRGEHGWHSFVRFPHREYDRLLTLLCSGRDIYLHLFEQKIEKVTSLRWIEITTEHPAGDEAEE